MILAKGEALQGLVRRRAPPSSATIRSPEFNANRENALRIERTAMEMQLELDERTALAAERKAALFAAESALQTVAHWAAQLKDGATTAAAAARREEYEARARVQRLKDLIEADVVKGRKLTSYPSLRTDLLNAGAEWVDEEVVVDAGLVSSRTPDDLPAFCAKLVEEVDEGEHAGQTA